jgi:cobalt-zinc-cadmium efflux system outer membrane protein
MNWRIVPTFVVCALVWNSETPAAPITLESALDRANASAFQLTAASAGVDAASGRARQAGVAPNPEIGIRSENVGGTGPYRAFNLTETTLEIGQRLELGGKRRARRVAAEAEVASARLRLDIARANLAFDVRQRYAEAFAARERVGLAQTLSSGADALARVTAKLVDAGREPPLRALRAKTAAAEAASRIRAAEADYAIARRALASTWGAPDELPEPLAERIAVPTDTVAPGDTLDARLAFAELENARAVIARERTLATPDPVVSLGVRRLNETQSTAFVGGLSIPIPIRDRNRGAIAAAGADAIGAEARRSIALVEATRRARDARLTLETATARFVLLQTATGPQANEALRLARQGYAAGKFSLLDVLDAQGALASARSDLIEARLSRAKAAAALLRATAR